MKKLLIMLLAALQVNQDNTTHLLSIIEQK